MRQYQNSLGETSWEDRRKHIDALDENDGQIYEWPLAAFAQLSKPKQMDERFCNTFESR